MSLRRILHPWFDIPEVHALRASCISQEADYISHERGETRADDITSETSMEDRKKEGYF